MSLESSSAHKRASNVAGHPFERSGKHPISMSGEPANKPKNRGTSRLSSPPKSDNRHHKPIAHSDSLALVGAVMMVTNGRSDLNIIIALFVATQTAI